MSGFDEIKFLDYVKGRVQKHLTTKNVTTERKMAGELYANFACHISWWVFFRAISSLPGYVSQSFIRGLKRFFFFSSKREDIWSKTYKYLGDRKIVSSIWSCGGGFGKVVSLLLFYTLLARHYLELEISFVQNVKSDRKHFFLY